MIRTTNWMLAPLIALPCIVAICGTAHAGVVKSTRTVVLGADSAPGTADGESIGILSSPMINNRGHVAFTSVLNGPTVTTVNHYSIWSETSDGLTMLARAGAAPPGLPDRRFLFLGASNFSDDGTVAFFSFLADPGSDSSEEPSYWLADPDGVSIVARRGDVVPGYVPPVSYFNPWGVAINDNRTIAFTVDVAVSNVLAGSSVWLEDRGTLTLAARAQMPVPDMPNVRFASIGTREILNPLGDTAFSAELVGPGLHFLNNGGVWVHRNGVLELIAKEDEFAPGTEAETKFSSLTNALIDGESQVAFFGSLLGPTLNFDNNLGIWAERAGQLTLIARSGQTIPGTEAGASLSQFVSMEMNLNGLITFLGKLNGDALSDANDNVLVAVARNGSQLIARDGQVAEGVDDAAVWRFDDYGSFAMNSAGQIAFSAFLEGVSVTASNNFGLWATDRAGELQLIARTGDQIEVEPGVFRKLLQISQVSGVAGADGRASQFNERGQIVFWARYEGGVGIFVTDAVAVPEPTALFVAIGAVALGSALHLRPR